MIIHQSTLISEDILEKEFVCNLNQCKGSCCVEGDFGAPLDIEEIDLIRKNIEGIKPYMTSEALELLEKDGFFENDDEHKPVTTCLQKHACIFAISENGIYKCAIEKAWNEGKSSFQKPISCHLYPIRLTGTSEFSMLNYDKWNICSPACKLGAELQLPVYKFLRESLVRRFGSEWYNELEELASVYNSKEM